MAIFPKLLYILNTVHITIPVGFFFFLEIHKLIFELIRNWEEHRLPKTILKKNKPGGFMIPDFKIYKKLQEARQCSAGISIDI